LKYWNLDFIQTHGLGLCKIQPIHLKYWNVIKCFFAWFLTSFNRYIWSIETKFLLFLAIPFCLFNRYIWSIETSLLLLKGAACFQKFNRYIWSIETLSKLSRGVVAKNSTDTFEVLKHFIFAGVSKLDYIQPIHLKYWNSYQLWTQNRT